jgi:hypothetical protein
MPAKRALVAVGIAMFTGSALDPSFVRSFSAKCCTALLAA